MSGITPVNTSPSGKRRHKSYPVNRRCYINNLPHDVLSHILSRLPIKDAVKTCVLSKDWEFKWTSIYNVHIDSDDFDLESGKEATIVNILERVVLHIQNLTNFSLSYMAMYGLSRIASVISAILRRNIKSLELHIIQIKDFFLPRSLWNCASLQKLSLIFNKPFSCRVPANNCFPNMQSLKLARLNIMNGNSMTDTLIFTFPLLKFFELMECKWVKVKFVEIYAPSLCTFSSMMSYDIGDKKGLDYSIKVHGARLAELTTYGYYPENIIMIGSTVASATLQCKFYPYHVSLGEWGLQFRKMLRGISNVKCLHMTDALKVIGRTKLGLPLPRFSELKKLNVVGTRGHPEGLLELLHAAPFLKSLEIVPEKDKYEYDYDSIENLPYCVTHHLEEVMVHYFYKPNYRVEKFLLKNGAQLKTFVIATGLVSVQGNNMVEKLSTFPKASTCLKILFRSIVFSSSSDDESC